MQVWKPGDRLRHRFNSELGPGRVVRIEGRSLFVEFPDSATVLRFSAASEALLPLEIARGARARLEQTGEVVLVEGPAGTGRVRLADGRVVADSDLWPVDVASSPVDLLAQGEVGSVGAFALRLDALHLMSARATDPLGSFLGGRIRLFPHQLYVAERATRSDPVRWLLADEVGLGKTVEACLILNHLVRSGRADRILVVAPTTLTVQWLGELWRKYHQVFVLLDERRLADVERDFGSDFNPFEVHRRAVISLELLQARPRLSQRAVEAGIDLLIVDEAHNLRRPPGHPGEPAYRAIAPIAALGRHMLLLTATPLEEDSHGFLRLVQLLRPEEFREDLPLEEALRRGDRLPPCTSATRRADIGGLPERSPCPVEITDAHPGWIEQERLERALRALPAPHVVASREKVRKIALASRSGASLLPALGPAGGADETLRLLARRALTSDPRLEWLAEAARRWRDRGEKTLVFVADRETLEVVRGALSRLAQIRSAAFHEELGPGQGDIEVAQFRLPKGPSILVSTECGGEGRNFEFCHREVLFDLPWRPATVEQRIGRLDRIGRSMPVEIVYFRHPRGLGAAVTRLYERIGVFREPLGGLEPELAPIEESIEAAALSEHDPIPEDWFDSVVRSAREAGDRVRRAAYRELHREPYRAEFAEGILARVPPDLDDLTQDVVLAACDELGLHVEEHRNGLRHSIEFGNRATVDSLPGVPGGSSFLGTFRREEAVADESVDYFASGHPLVEGILAELEDGSLGRTAVLRVDGKGERGFGLVAFYRDSAAFEALAVDASGSPRPDWARLVSTRPLRTRRVQTSSLTQQVGWAETIRRLAGRLRGRGRPIAVAALLVG